MTVSIFGLDANVQIPADGLALNLGWLSLRLLLYYYCCGNDGHCTEWMARSSTVRLKMGME